MKEFLKESLEKYLREIPKIPLEEFVDFFFPKNLKYTTLTIINFIQKMRQLRAAEFNTF